MGNRRRDSRRPEHLPSSPARRLPAHGSTVGQAGLGKHGRLRLLFGDVVNELMETQFIQPLPNLLDATG